MDNPIPVDLGRVAQDLQIRRVQVESVVQLLDEGNTVPFITRYRKERTGNLNEVVIREIQLRVHRLRELAERKETILKAIEAQGRLIPELAAAIRAAENPKRLEDLYLPFKPKKRTKASDARDKGLEPLAVRVWNRDEQLTDPVAAAQEFVSAEKGLETPEQVLEGVGHILAEAISEMAAVRDAVRKVVWKTAKIATSKGDIPEGQGLEYRDYFDYSEPLSQVPPHRVLAINRGDKEGPLKIRLEVPRPELESAFVHQLPLEGHPQAALFRTAAIDALDRLILPSMEREIRRDLTEAAEKHAVEVFARNLRSLLLQPPIPKQVVLAIDPGLRSGCKVAVLDPNGNLLDHGVVYPHVPQNRRSETKLFLKDLVGRHKVGVVAIGNGTACRETEELVAEIIAEGTQFSQGEAVPQGAGETQASGESLHEEPGAAVAESETPDSPRAEHHATVEQAIATGEGGQPPASLESEHSARSTGLDHSAQPSPAAGESPAAEDAHAIHHEALTVPELSEETLPPIIGGAPEPASPEAETEPDLAPTPGDGESAAAPHHERPDQVEQNHAASSRADGEHQSEQRSEDHAAAGAETHVAAQAEQVANSVPESSAEEQGPEAPEQGAEAVSIAAEPAIHADKPIEVGHSDASEAGPAPVEDTAEGTDAASASPAGPETMAAAEVPAALVEAKPSHESRRGGSGKHEHGRSRGSRPKPSASPPPPPTPPAPHAADPLLAQLAYVIVNEAGASVYSTSQIGREELPEFDATLRSAISIGRRLQDPLAELVKIEPQNIGVGLYQHDVNPKQLKETLEAVISSCVNFVGVDLNTASVPLLRHVSGLNQLTARRIVDYRKDKGTFATREQLKEVDGVGPATYTQAAGFLKIPEGVHPLDRTWIHPESYAIATLLLERFGKTPEVVRDKQQLPELHHQLEESAPPELAKELQIGEFTLRDIIEALGRPERDPRDDLPKPIFKKGILKLEDLSAGMELKGTVLNVVDFGAFVDIGLKDSGLVHISQLANRYIKTPHDVVSVGDVVTVWVMSVDQERKRVSLTMVKPGTERQRGAAQGGQRRGPGGGEQREGQAGQGQGRRERARPPRPSGSALTSPPVGAAPIAALAEPPARRPDRERGGLPGSAGLASPAEGGAGQSSGPAGSQAFPGSRPAAGFPGPPGSSRVGPRGGPLMPGPGGARPAPGRQERPQGQRGPSRPSRPSPPPPPLSKEALSGSVPLRTFGQLKQLWEARVDPTPEELAAEAAAAAAQAGQPQGEPSEAANTPAGPAHPEQADQESAPTTEPDSGASETQ